MDVLSQLPVSFWDVRYVSERYPGSPSVRRQPGLASGANCQLYVYEVVRYFGREVPDLRSSELWADTERTERVEEPQGLDLVLFNATADPWGAHVGLWVGEDRVLHLCAEVGWPVVWPGSEFGVRERYRTRLGFKRIR